MYMDSPSDDRENDAVVLSDCAFSDSRQLIPLEARKRSAIMTLTRLLLAIVILQVIIMTTHAFAFITSTTPCRAYFGCRRAELLSLSASIPKQDSSKKECKPDDQNVRAGGCGGDAFGMSSTSSDQSSSSRSERTTHDDASPPPEVSSTTKEPDDSPLTSSCVFWNVLLWHTTTRSGTLLAELPRFVDFCQHHMDVAQHWNGQAYIPNLLQGGKSTGPISTTDTPGQIVRAAAVYPNLTAKPRHFDHNDNNTATTLFQHDDLRWVTELQEQHLPKIQDELRRVAPTLPEDGVWTSLRTHRGKDWSDDTGWAHIALVDNFQYMEDNIKKFPETFRIINNVVDGKTEKRHRIGPRLVAIARQKAHSGIPEHVDFMNWMLTLHTALDGPDEGGCGMIVNGVARDWTVGDPVVMDTTFRHETYNDSDQDLYLLLVDFWHPDLSVDEIDALRSFFAANSGV